MGSKHVARSKTAVAVFALVVACAAAAAFLIAARKAAQPQQTAYIEAQPETAAVPDMAPKSGSATVAPGKNTQTPARTTAVAKSPSGAAKAVSPARSPATIATYQAAAVQPHVVESGKAPAQDVPVRAAMLASSAVTIAGCLERDGDSFRLKDTDGTAAPKSRSWKSGFLKKGPPKIEVVDTANRLKLPDHVGQRVSVTGTLNDGEMQARSLQRVSASCE